MIVLGCTAGTGLAEGVARELGSRYASVDYRIFPDGESYLKVPSEVKGDDVLIVQSMNSPQDKRFFEMLEAIDGANNAGAAHVYALIPYLAYARQDKSFAEGEPISAKIVLDHLRYAGVEKLAVVNPHKSKELDYFRGSTLSIDAMPYVASRAIEEIENPFILAPDNGAAEMAKGVAEAHSLDWGTIDKERSRSDGSIKIKEAPNMALKGRNVLIIDDMISSGGTVIQAAKFAFGAGAASVRVAAIHLLLAGNALGAMKDAGIESILGANSIEEEIDGCKIIDISGFIARALSAFV
ncbi:MAG: ribose-phosphate diphosphokinase [Candidatus Micrarchaeia archaeon]